MTTPKVTLPRKNKVSHGTLYTIAGTDAFFCVIHAVIAAVLEWQPHLLNVHIAAVMVLGLLAWRAESNQRRNEAIAAQKMIDDIEDWLDGDPR
ncbi:hypothetical protein SD37_11460 [Amycolatopsis orientalis]|uniref:Small integral membrane protein n=1 Tax=Amycolatopsis orientalis TaxID=31958 RepID=A0A193BVJ9_AMYOR|nr:hypothetical protein [Amycolatopsis orientalis]ANN16194.1 hypothetical protein SD37_11460 [Amycolatopsis orientalis]